MKKLAQKTSLFVFAAALIVWPCIARAGLGDLAARATSWWNSHSAGVIPAWGKQESLKIMGSPIKAFGDDNTEKKTDTNKNGEKKEGEDTNKDSGAKKTDTNDNSDKKENGDKQSGNVAPAATPGMCRVPQEPAIRDCEIGAGFICISTPRDANWQQGMPANSVTGDFVVIRGTIDRKNSVLAGIRIAAQNEYTKATSIVDTNSPAESGCSDSAAPSKPFCIDKEGRFAAKIELTDRGPYTVSVTATRLSGGSEEQSVRVSRVIAPAFDASKLTLDPDVKKNSTTDKSEIVVTASLLGDCQFCDFIGASTNGLAVTVENVIKDSAGKERRITCKSTVEQGGSGKFSIGVPVGAGTNTLSISACNAAVEASSCPRVSGITFTASGGAIAEEGIKFILPDPQPSYDSKTYQTIPWKFGLPTAGACIDVQFNRDAPKEICPDSKNEFSITLAPKSGINVATIAKKGGAEEQAWTFGFGTIVSPYANSSGSIDVPSAVEAGIPANAAKNILLPFINNFLGSDEFHKILNDALKGVSGNVSAADDATAGLIPNCGQSGDTAELKSSIRGDPVIESAAIENFEFGDNRINFTLVLSGLTLGVDVISNPALPPLPIIIIFRKARVDLSLVYQSSSDNKPLILLTTPHTDCEFKAASYCKNTPAPLIPANFVGGATAWGGFMSCDTSLAQGEAQEACAAINSLNAQTGVVSEKLLDALNAMIYCKGSSSLTRAIRNRMNFPATCIGSCGKETSGIMSVMPSVNLTFGIDIGDGLKISNDGILINAGLALGDSATYSKTPAQARIPSAGISVGKGFGARAFSSPVDSTGNLNLALSLDTVNALLFALSVQGDGRGSKGLLDWDIHEPMFNKLGFDFVKECDEFEATPGSEEKKSALCDIRPRATVMLGNVLQEYGYLSPNQPLMLSIRGNRALAPRISAVTLEDLPVVKQQETTSAGSEPAAAYTPNGSLFAIELGGVEISFYALATDETKKADQDGNLSIKLDAQGQPIIKSMRPENSDPWNGQIVSFDLTLLLGIELRDPEPDPNDQSQSRMPVRILTDRTRLVLTPIPGSNATTVPSVALVSALSGKAKTKLGDMGREDFYIPLPKEFNFSADANGVFEMLGLAKINFGKDGLALTLEPEENKLIAAFTAVITQILHKGGQEQTYNLPK